MVLQGYEDMTSCRNATLLPSAGQIQNITFYGNVTETAKGDITFFFFHCCRKGVRKGHICLENLG